MPHPPNQPPADGPICRAGLDKSTRRRRGSSKSWDRQVAQIAAGQHGLISLDQLRALGMKRDTAHWRVRVGVLHQVHQGVFAVGHPRLTGRGKLMAAVLACGPGAVLSHRSAVELWELRKNAGGRSIDVTAPHRRGRIPKEISAHRDGSLKPEDRTEVNGIPCTTVARTLLDFAAVAPVWELRKGVSEISPKFRRRADKSGRTRQIGPSAP